MPSEDILRKIRALMARAVDPGATEEEQRTSAHVAAKLCREHGVDLGAASVAPEESEVRASRSRVEVVTDGVRTIVETVSSARPGLDAALGFDVFGFVQERLREHAKAAIVETLSNGRSRKRPVRRPARRK